MDLARSRELLHRINLLCARGVLPAETRIRLHELLSQPPDGQIESPQHHGGPSAPHMPLLGQPQDADIRLWGGGPFQSS